MNQVDKTLYFLKHNPTTYTSQDSQLMEDFTSQYFLFCENFQYGLANTNTPRKEDILLSKSLAYLKNLIATNCTNEQNDLTDNEPSNAFVVASMEDAKKCYLMKGEPIRFKVFKNKPKNGDFRVRWNRNYVQLKEFKERYGHMQVTRSTSGYSELGNWVAEQRRKLKRGKITQSQFETLSELGKLHVG